MMNILMLYKFIIYKEFVLIESSSSHLLKNLPLALYKKRCSFYEHFLEHSFYSYFKTSIICIWVV